MIPGPGPSVSRHSERHCNVYNTRSHSTTVAERVGGPVGGWVRGGCGGGGELGGVQEEEEEEKEGGGSEIDFTRCGTQELKKKKKIQRTEGGGGGGGGGLIVFCPSQLIFFCDTYKRMR